MVAAQARSPTAAWWCYACLTSAWVSCIARWTIGWWQRADAWGAWLDAMVLTTGAGWFLLLALPGLVWLRPRWWDWLLVAGPAVHVGIAVGWRL